MHIYNVIIAYLPNTAPTVPTTIYSDGKVLSKNELVQVQVQDIKYELVQILVQ